MPPENRLDLWDVNTRLKSIPWIPNETRVSFRNETPVSIGIVIFVKIHAFIVPNALAESHMVEA